MRNVVIVGGLLLRVVEIFIARPVRVPSVPPPSVRQGDEIFYMCDHSGTGVRSLTPELSLGFTLALALTFVGFFLGFAPWHMRSPEAHLRDDRGERLCAFLALALAASVFVGTTFFPTETFTRFVNLPLFLGAAAVTLMTRTESPTR